MTTIGFDIAVSRDNFPTRNQVLDFFSRVFRTPSFPSILNADLERCDNATLRWVVHSCRHTVSNIESESLALKNLRGEITPRDIELMCQKVNLSITLGGYRLLEMVAMRLILQRGGEVD